MKSLLLGVLLFIQSDSARLDRSPDVPKDVWPITYASWLSLFLSIASAVGILYGFWRWSNKPILQAIQNTRTHFDRELKEVKEDIEKDMDTFRERVTSDLNGFGGRQEKFEERVNGMDLLVTGLGKAMVDSQRDRENIKENVVRILKNQEDDRRHNEQFQQDLLKLLLQQQQNNRGHGR